MRAGDESHTLTGLFRALIERNFSCFFDPLSRYESTKVYFCRESIRELLPAAVAYTGQKTKYFKQLQVRTQGDDTFTITLYAWDLVGNTADHLLIQQFYAVADTGDIQCRLIGVDNSKLDLEARNSAFGRQGFENSPS